MTKQRQRRAGSGILHAIVRVGSKPTFAVVVVTVGIAWVVGSVAFGFPSRVETAFQTVVSAVTVAMLFVILHTEAREQTATQRKLDEILKSLPSADNSLIAFEDAPDGEIRRTRDAHRQLRNHAVTRRGE